MASEQVKERLLDAAEKLFTEKGYDRTNVRDLTAEAGCNIAAVNYHFGGKDKLYIEMFRRNQLNLIKAQTENIKRVLAMENATLEDLIRVVAKKHFEELEEGTDKPSVLKLLVREILEPHLTEEIIPREMFEDVEQQYIDAIVELSPGIKYEDGVFCRFSSGGVLMYPVMFYRFYLALKPELTLDELVEHTVKFCCAGIRSFAK